MTTTSPSTNRRLVPVAAGLTAFAALVTLGGALALGGGAAPLLLGDAGPVVRWGIPIVKTTVNLAAAGLVGALVTALYALRAGERTFDIALRLASVSGAALTVAAAASGILSYLDITSGGSALDITLVEQLRSYALEWPPGRMWLTTVIVGAALTVLSATARSWRSTLFAAAVAIALLVPMGAAGHSSALADHASATSSIVLHTIGAAVWLGGLMLLVAVRDAASRTQLAVIVARYSTLALMSFIVLVASGTVRAFVGLSSLADLDSPYGAILLVKVLTLVALGAIGVVHRRRVIPHLRDGHAPSRLWRLVVAELALMGAASGAAAALARTPPPPEETPGRTPTAAELLTGSPLPAEPLLTDLIGLWSIDAVWALVIGFALFFYMAGVRRLRRRAQPWPLRRSISWGSGLLLLLWVTCGWANAYQECLFSVRLASMAVLAFMIPLLLVGGAPLTLASRAIGPRDDGTRGGREWIAVALRSRGVRIAQHPAVCAALLVGSLWAFTGTGLLRWSLEDEFVHAWMVCQLLVVGCLFVRLFRRPIRPGVRRSRAVLLVGVIAALTALTVPMLAGDILLPEWFDSLDRDWGLRPAEDQRIGTAIALSIAGLTALTLAGRGLAVRSRRLHISSSAV